MFNYIINKLKNDFDIKDNVYHDGTSYKFQIRKQKDCIKLINLMYDNATIYLDRKFEKVKEIKSIAV